MKIRAKVDIEVYTNCGDEGCILKGESVEVVRICVGGLIGVDFKGEYAPLNWDIIKNFIEVVYD